MHTNSLDVGALRVNTLDASHHYELVIVETDQERATLSQVDLLNMVEVAIIGVILDNGRDLIKRVVTLSQVLQRPHSVMIRVAVPSNR